MRKRPDFTRVIGAEVDDAYIAELKKQVLHKDAIEAAGKGS